MSLKVYPCSKAKHARWWQALRGAGLPIVASWIDWAYNADDATAPSARHWREHWKRCCDEAAAADICLFVHLAGETACGQLLEAGCALAAGRQVFMVSPTWWSIEHHERVRKFPDLEAAIVAIMAQVAGERARTLRVVGPAIEEFG